MDVVQTTSMTISCSLGSTITRSRSSGSITSIEIGPTEVSLSIEERSRCTDDALRVALRDGDERIGHAQVGVLAEPEDGEIVIGRGVKVEVVAVPDGSGRRQPRTKPQLP
jgi:hypothetical protein